MRAHLSARTPLLALALIGLGGLYAGCSDDAATTEVKPGVTVADQTLSTPTEVTVAAVTTPDDAWIVIHADAAGTPGPVLGQTLVRADGATDITVTLSRDAINGETLYAMLHVDEGEFGTYEFPGPDVPALDDAGEVITPAFKVLGGGVVGPETDAVTVADQTADPANQVVVAEVLSAAAGWIVIHEDDGSGSFGGVLGQTAVVAGTTADVVVTLSRDAVDGETLYAMLHIDAGVAGTYEFPGPDGPVVDKAGAVITPSFVVTVVGPETDAVTVADQTAAPANQVVVAEVLSAAAGWIVIHEDDGSGSFGGVLGQTAVAAGTTADVVVTLSRDAVDGETLYAMLHIDAGVAGTYEFPGPDGPVVDKAGAVITPSFVVTVVTNAMTVSDQGVDPIDEVVIDSVTADIDGFVVIHEDDGAGSPGGVIGSAAVSAGTSTDVVVVLDRPIVHGETLWPMLHIDAGILGTYEFPGPDGPATDAEGSVVVLPMVVTLLPRVTVSDQTADPVTQVVIDSVVSPVAGFLVIHEGDGAGGVGGVIGFGVVAVGPNVDLVVTLDRDAVDGETLYAMLHLDAGVAGTYEFPGPDGPLLDEAGAVIAPPFVVSVP